MRLSHRLRTLETTQGIGRGVDGSCGYCRGRERELGRVVIRTDPADYQPLCRWDTYPPNPPPTLCPRCGSDMNTTIVVHHVDLVAKRLAERGLAASAITEV